MFFNYLCVFYLIDSHYPGSSVMFAGVPGEIIFRLYILSMSLIELGLK